MHKNTSNNWFDTNVSPPFLEMNIEKREWDEKELNASKDEFLSIDSQPKHLEPSYLGQYIDKAATLYVLSTRQQGVLGEGSTNL